jgi:acid phosphatase (class A)
MSLNGKLRNPVAVLIVTMSLTGCGSTPVGSSIPGDATRSLSSVPEIMPGVLQGYLTDKDQLDSRVFVPPAPASTSAVQSMDTAWSEKMLALRGSPRWDMATRDAHLGFPAAAETFSCALGFEVTESTTPALYMLLRRTLADIGLATYPAKKNYQRGRPFMSNEQATCTPDEETALRQDGSYPSGHTAVGWGWGLILSELHPERSEQIIARGRAFGESRTVCNVHWYSDVVAGRLVGAAAVARLHNNEDFLAEMDAARLEVSAMSEADQSESAACKVEAGVLAAPL